MHIWKSVDEQKITDDVELTRMDKKISRIIS